MATYDFYRKYQELFENPRENLLQRQIYRDGLNGPRMGTPRDPNGSNDSLVNEGRPFKRVHVNPLQEAWDAQRDETDMRMSRYRRAIDRVRIKSLQAEELSQPSRALMELKMYEVDRAEKLRELQNKETDLAYFAQDNTKRLLHHAGIRSLNENLDSKLPNKESLRRELPPLVSRDQDYSIVDMSRLPAAGVKRVAKQDPRYRDHIFELLDEFADIQNLRPGSEAKRRPTSNLNSKNQHPAGRRLVNKSLELSPIQAVAEKAQKRVVREMGQRSMNVQDLPPAGYFRRLLRDDEQLKEILLNQAQVNHLDSQNPRKRSDKNLKPLLYEKFQLREPVQNPIQIYNTPPKRKEPSKERSRDESPGAVGSVALSWQIPDQRFRRYKRTPSPSPPPQPTHQSSPPQENQVDERINRMYYSTPVDPPALKPKPSLQPVKEQAYQQPVPKIPIQERPSEVPDYQNSHRTLMKEDRLVDIQELPESKENSTLAATFGPVEIPNRNEVIPQSKPAPMNSKPKTQFTEQERKLLRNLTFGKKSQKPDGVPLFSLPPPDAFKPRSSAEAPPVRDRIPAASPQSQATRAQQPSPRMAAGVPVTPDGVANPSSQLPTVVQQAVNVLETTHKHLPLLAKTIATAVADRGYTSCLQQEWMVTKAFEQKEILENVQNILKDDDRTIEVCLAAQRRAVSHLHREVRANKLRGMLTVPGNKVG